MRVMGWSDGDFGPASESAVINFQGRNGLVADGIVGANTNTKINQIIASCTVQPPTINYFNANPSTIDSGNYSALSWSVTNATTISISSIGSVSASGSQNVYPSTTTTYTLTATGAGGTRTQNVMVTVNTVRPFPPTSCAGVTFSTTLRNGMSSRQDIRCMQGMLNHSNLNLGINPPLVEDGNFGSATEAGVRKFQTKYGFTADGIVGSQTYAKLNELIGVVTPPPVINSFSANPSTINSGGSSALSWSVANADSVSISSIGAVALSGSQNVSPSATTTYTLTAIGAGGTRTQNVTVTVNTTRPFPPISCSDIAFTRDLYLGVSAGNDINCLQEF